MGNYGDYDQRAKHGMKSDRMGVDRHQGKFLLFDVQHARDVVELLVENSCVRFGASFFHQTSGIPMGINPAVFMANLYLFHYEYTFVKQLTDLVRAHNLTHTPGAFPTVGDVLQCRDLHELQELGLQDTVGDAAFYLLQQFQYMVRFVDDLTSGPNRLLADLLYTNQTVLCGLVKGIYPQQFLTLDRTQADPCSFTTLDLRIVSVRFQVSGDDGVEWVVRSYTALYDKRTEACYRDIPIVRYTHVSSTLSVHSGYNIILSQLHRYRELIMLRGNYVVEAAKLLLRMEQRGYNTGMIWGKCKHHLQKFYDTYGDSSSRGLTQNISDCLAGLRALPGYMFEYWPSPLGLPEDSVSINWEGTSAWLPQTRWNL